MKKNCLVLLVMLFSFNIKPAKAQFPVFDFGAIGQEVLSAIERVDQAITASSQIKTIDNILEVLGGIQAGIAWLTNLAATIEEYVRLLNKGIDLVQTALEVVEENISIIDEIRELLLYPINIAAKAVELSASAVKLVGDAEEYAQKYRDATKAAQEVNSSDANGLEKVTANLETAQKYLNISKQYLRQAQALADEAEELIEEIVSIYYDVLNLIKKMIRNIERACYLQIEAQQLKEAFFVAACDKDSIVNDNGYNFSSTPMCKKYLEEKEAKKNDKPKKSQCRKFTDDLKKDIKDFENKVADQQKKIEKQLREQAEAK